MTTDPITQTTVLHKAAEAVQARGVNYGTPAENHGRTAAMWSAYLGVEVTARDVCMLNILQKVSRDRARPIEDNPVDIAGYAENAGLVAASQFDPMEYALQMSSSPLPSGMVFKDIEPGPHRVEIKTSLPEMPELMERCARCKAPVPPDEVLCDECIDAEEAEEFGAREDAHNARRCRVCDTGLVEDEATVCSGCEHMMREEAIDEETGEPEDLC